MVRIYGLVDPLSDRVFYIGASNQVDSALIGRHKSTAGYDGDKAHPQCAKKYQLIKERFDSGVGIKVVTLELVREKQAPKKEREYYYKYKEAGFDLYQDERKLNYHTWNQKRKK